MEAPDVKSDSALEGEGKAPPPEDFLIKVCGITNLEDALLSVELGANALGFNFYVKSPRFIELDATARILEQLPPKVLTVGLVVFGAGDQNPDSYGGTRTKNREILTPICELNIDAFQFHGLEDRNEVPEVGQRIFIATSPEMANHFSSHEIIIDTSWGSGLVADWDLVGRTVQVPFALSGGLTPDNVGEALARLHPVGVDVCSGVELAPGRKDPDKLRAFLGVVRAYVSRSNS